MAPLEELQELWRSQPQPPMAAVDSRGMTAALRRFGRRQNAIYAAKAAVVAVLVWCCYSLMGRSAVTAAGAGLLLAGALGAIFTDWSSQMAIARLDFTQPSAGFVESVLERLRNAQATFRRLLWLHMIPVCIGINLLFAAHSLAVHIAATLSPFAGCAIGLRLRSKRFAAEYRPLVERLTAMQTALKEDSQ